MKNKNYNFIIIIIIVLIIFVGAYLIYDANFNITFKLEKEIIEIMQGNNIISNYEAYDSSGNSLKDEVIIDDQVNINTPGEYQRCFTLKHGLYNKTLCQKIIVKENIALSYEIKLIGDSTIYLRRGTTYNDSGAKVYDNGKEVNININKSGTLDTTKVGEYEIKYSFNMNNIYKEVKRKIIVYEVTSTITTSPIEKTTGPVKINVIVNSEYYSHTILPNNQKDNSNNITYEVNDNGNYKFIIYDKYNYSKEEIVVINNIQRDYKCNGVINRKGTTLTVSGKGLEYIKNYNYNLDGINYSGTNNYNIYKKIKKASVSLVLNNNSKLDINCTLTNNLIYTPHYDYDNLKPLMKCDTYTSSDKIKYDKMLSDAIKEAGIGTRAGVVEAARFILLGMDYRVKYVGPKKYDTGLGSYNRIGLNIGQKGAWGCSQSGWTQGLDCTGFVSWLFKQNDLSIKGGHYSTSDTYKLVDVVDKIKAGDFLLSPNNGALPNKTSAFVHIGIIIGIDDKYIYEAESTTGTIDSLVITRLDKSNLSTKTVVRLYKYDSEGNYTNMWLQ